MKSRKIVARSLQGAVGSLALAMSAAAFAVPVTAWDFVVNSGFTSYQGDGGGGSGVTGSNNNALLSAASLLSWGVSTGFGQSSLGVGAATNGNFTGSVATNGLAVNTVQVIHQNYPIFAPHLVSATLTDVISLQSIAPYLGAPSTPAALFFNIRFLETPNNGSCPDGGQANGDCNDIFAIDVAGAGFNPADNSLNQTFWYDSEDYNAILRITGLGVLSNSACDAVYGDALHHGCIGFTTVEGLQNTMQVSLQITDTPYVVPEPGTVGLLGLAFASLGWGMRRKYSC